MKTHSINTFWSILLVAFHMLINQGVQAAVVLEWVTVGDAGNAADSTGHGSVSYAYQIMKYEVTNAQYTEFLNHKAASDPYGLYDESMGADVSRGGILRSGGDGNYTYSVAPNMANKPVNYISHLDAQRFANWIHNGQENGDTESGAYNVGSFAIHTPTATVWLPTVDEWYKAAYYQPFSAGGDADNYWAYPTRSNDAPTRATSTILGDVANPGTNVANYGQLANWNGSDGNGNVTTVGSAGIQSASYFGTFDQGGNILEWTDGVHSAAHRYMQGGSWNNIPSVLMQSSSVIVSEPTSSGHETGFRLAGLLIPEPSRAMLFLTGLLSLFFRRVRIHAAIRS